MISRVKSQQKLQQKYYYNICSLQFPRVLNMANIKRMKEAGKGGKLGGDAKITSLRLHG